MIKHFTRLLRSLRNKKQGFTILEIGVVLTSVAVILTLMAVGAEVQQNSRMVTIYEEVGKIASAVDKFEAAYGALPGDIGDTSGFDPDPDDDTDGVKPGNANGFIDNKSESLQFWKHLSLAGLYKGRYTGEVGEGGTIGIGTEIPKAPFKNTGFKVYNMDSVPIDYTLGGSEHTQETRRSQNPTMGLVGCSWMTVEHWQRILPRCNKLIETAYGGSYMSCQACPTSYQYANSRPGYVLVLTSYSGYSYYTHYSAKALTLPLAIDVSASGDKAFLTPEDAESIDRRFDDGVPNTGNIRAYNAPGSTACVGDSTRDGTVTGGSYQTGGYSSSRKQCIMRFILRSPVTVRSGGGCGFANGKKLWLPGGTSHYCPPGYKGLPVNTCPNPGLVYKGCKPMYCDHLGANYEMGETRRMPCPDGYAGKGIVQTCESTGLWKEKTKDCTAVEESCGATELGFYKVKSCPISFTGDILYQCQDDGSGNLAWSEIEDNCQEITCPRDGDIAPFGTEEFIPNATIYNASPTAGGNCHTTGTASTCTSSHTKTMYNNLPTHLGPRRDLPTACGDDAWNAGSAKVYCGFDGKWQVRDQSCSGTRGKWSTMTYNCAYPQTFQKLSHEWVCYGSGWGIGREHREYNECPGGLNPGEYEVALDVPCPGGQVGEVVRVCQYSGEMKLDYHNCTSRCLNNNTDGNATWANARPGDEVEGTCLSGFTEVGTLEDGTLKKPSRYCGENGVWQGVKYPCVDPNTNYDTGCVMLPPGTNEYGEQTRRTEARRLCNESTGYIENPLQGMDSCGQWHDLGWESYLDYMVRISNGAYTTEEEMKAYSQNVWDTYQYMLNNLQCTCDGSAAQSFSSYSVAYGGSWGWRPYEEYYDNEVNRWMAYYEFLDICGTWVRETEARENPYKKYYDSAGNMMTCPGSITYASIGGVKICDTSAYDGS